MPTLNWIGKEAVINHHDEVPIHTLTHDPDRSVGVENEPLGTGNLLIEGDNLLALKALLPYYAGRVKCIYDRLPAHNGSKIIHCGGTRLTEGTLKQLGITFRQMPYNLV